MLSNSLSTLSPPCRGMAPDDEVCAAQPFAVVRRQIRGELEIKVPRDFGGYFPGQGKPSRGVEGQEIIDRLQQDEAGFPGAGHRNLALQKPADLVRPRRDPGNVLQAQLLSDLIERIARAISERLRRQWLSRFAARRVMKFGPRRT